MNQIPPPPVWELALMTLFVILPMMLVGGGILIVLLAMWRQTRIQDMRHRERLAMIERGLMPPPERDPAAFHARDSYPGPHARFVSIGVAVVAVGLGVMLIIGFAGGSPGPAVGVGGAITLLGIAFIVNGLLHRGDRRVPAPTAAPPMAPTDPPGPAAP
jgi:hypothetical protein